MLAPVAFMLSGISAMYSKAYSMFVLKFARCWPLAGGVPEYGGNGTKKGILKSPRCLIVVSDLLDMSSQIVIG